MRGGVEDHRRIQRSWLKTAGFLFLSIEIGFLRILYSKLDLWGRGYPLGLRTQGPGFDSRWIRSFFVYLVRSLDSDICLIKITADLHHHLNVTVRGSRRRCVHLHQADTGEP